MLIDLKSLNKAEQNTKEPENQPVLFLSVPECRNLADSETSLRKQIGILEHNVCINFWSYGSFSLHELMFYILQQTGPAHINMCTWSISQDAIEKIIRKYQKGEILSIRFLLDPRVKVCKAKPLQMLSATFSHKILRVHAKVSSQNATTNPKLERGVIFISDEIFNFDKTVFEHEFNTARTGNNRETGRTVLHPQTDCNNSGNRSGFYLRQFWHFKFCFETYIRSETGNTYRAYYKGYYEADIELRKSITQSALSGSSPAQTMLRDIQKQSRISE